VTESFQSSIAPKGNRYSPHSKPLPSKYFSNLQREPSKSRSIFNL
jgi:hypothetical protein